MLKTSMWVSEYPYDYIMWRIILEKAVNRRQVVGNCWGRWRFYGNVGSGLYGEDLSLQ
jgi:hypothetical protein